MPPQSKSGFAKRSIARVAFLGANDLPCTVRRAYTRLSPATLTTFMFRRSAGAITISRRPPLAAEADASETSVLPA